MSDLPVILNILSFSLLSGWWWCCHLTLMISGAAACWPTSHSPTVSPLLSPHLPGAGWRRVALIGANLRPAANQSRPERPIGKPRQETLLGRRLPYLFMKKLQWCIIIVIDLLFGRYWQRKITSSAENCFTINFLSLRDVFSQFDWNKKARNFSLRLFISVNSWHTLPAITDFPLPCPLPQHIIPGGTDGSDGFLMRGNWSPIKGVFPPTFQTYLTNKGRGGGEIRGQNNKMVNLRWVRWVGGRYVVLL